MANHLKDIQTWIYGVITEAQGIEVGADQTKIDNVKWEIDAVVAPSNKLNSYERINIYRDSYFIRLIECLKHEYKGLLNALGSELFDHFAWSYLQSFPSTSYTLNDLGKQFPQYLQNSLEKSLNGQEPDWWQLFILDMAKYERTFVEIFNGEGHEQLVSNKFFTKELLKPSPSIRTLQLNFPISDCIGNFRKDETNTFPNLEKVNYVFGRNNYRVIEKKVSDVEYETLHNWIKNSSEKCPTEYQTGWKLNGVCYS